MNTKKSNKKFIIILLLIIISTFLIYKVYNSNKELDSNTETYTSSSNSFAIMLEQEDGSYVLSDSNTWPDSTYDFNDSLSNCVDSNGNTLNNASISYSSGTIKVTGNTEAYCVIYFDLYRLNCVEEGVTSLSECILRSENNFQTEDAAITYIKDKGTPDFSVTATTDEGLYYATDDYGDSYYFRGATTDNYVYFAGYYWRIIRINGDGSIRMIYDGTSAHGNGEKSSDRIVPSSAFNSSYEHNGYVGYMYGNTGYAVTSNTQTLTLQSYYYYYSTSYTFDPETGNYTLGDDASQRVWDYSYILNTIRNSGAVYTCRNTTSCKNLYYIYSPRSEYAGYYYTYTSTSETDENGNKVYSESHGTSSTLGTFAARYLYFTSATYNTETGKFGYDGSVKWLVYSGSSNVVGYYTCLGGNTCSTIYYIESVKNETQVTAKRYVSSNSDSYESTHANTNDSTIKTAVDAWYLSNIYNATDGTNSYDDYISDTLFCNDRSIYSGSGTGTSTTYYSAHDRLINNKLPILTCSQKNDRFTVDDEVNGNGDLTYKVGLITADEIAMAGTVFQTNNDSFYLYGAYFYSMTPGVYSTNTYAHVFNIGSSASKSYVLAYYYPVGISHGVRPVINLSSSVILTSGDGTKDSPYQVSLS